MSKTTPTPIESNQPLISTEKTPSLSLKSLASTGDALAVLRTETAISRFPLHRIAKKGGDIAIEIHNQAAAVQWSVSHNTKYGQPGPLAYRIDTLLVNRRIEEAGKPVPRLIRLGSLPEIANELGYSGHNWGLLRRAIHQNASAYITAKISYRAADRSERLLEAGFNRYSVIFTGETLPSGEVANCVCLVLSDIFLEVLNTAMWRPLNYDYMKTLPVGSQRFYEIASYQIFAALKHRNPRARVFYSEYCLLSTATRYPDFDHVKKQMYKILRPHIKSGYLAKVEYEATTDERGEPDWIMHLTPGPNADQEFNAFTGQGKMRKPGTATKAKANLSPNPPLPFTDDTDARPTPPLASDTEEQPAESNESRELIEALTSAELNRGDAIRFAHEKPEVCRRQLEYLPFVASFKTSRGAYLRRAIEEEFGPPAAYSKAREKQEQEQTSKRRRAQELLETVEKKARQRHQEAHQAAFAAFLCEWVGEWERNRPEAHTAFRKHEEEKRRVLETGPLAQRPMTRHALETFDQETMRADRLLDFCRDEGREFRLQPPTFWEWDATTNPHPFVP